ncbi:YbaB/EbfC family nucleoid-associated protein [Micromonospora sp. NPDC126480]|uniref:YbaB/EbfC family nucleoid-associated protein n=1 Tax=Micromonospora sp. NPDC126480 TaxID=3155312 RepID=UPI0033304EE9
MTDLPSQFLGRFTGTRATAEAADGLVRLVVDGTGDLLELDLDPRAMRLPAVDLAAAIRAAFATARAEVQAALQEQLAAAPPALPDGLGPLLDEVGTGAQRRLDDLTATAQQLADRLNRLG